MSSKSTSKRRRTAADALHISDLPIGFIADVSAYLSKPSRAILAVAFSASSSSWQNVNLIHCLPPISTAIVSASKWDILDFEEVEKELANKLTDDDISAILKSINAHDVLKRLKLSGTNITGIGLNPLQGSVVLEQIDLSFAGKYKKQDIEPEPKISQAAIVPILDSIISVNGCSLKYIQFPKKWRYIGTRNASGEIHPISEFRTRFNQYRTSLGLSCSKCSANMRDYREWLDGMFENTITCYECLKPTCYNCADTEEASFCVHCRKKYCTDCIPVTECTSCDEEYCKGCMDKACDECGDAKCNECIFTCDGCSRIRCEYCAHVRHCEGDNCNKSHCSDCYNGMEYDVKSCRDCGMRYCLECKFVKLRNFGFHCNACAGDVAHLIQEYEEDREVEELRS